MHKLKQLWSTYCLGWNRLRELVSLNTTTDLKRHTFVTNCLFVCLLLMYLLITGVALYVDVTVYGWFDFRTILVNVSVLILIVVVAIQIRVLKYMRLQQKFEQEVEPDALQCWMKQRGVQPPIWSPALPEQGVVIGAVCVRGSCPGRAIGEFWFNELGQMELQIYGESEVMSVQ